MDVRNPYKTLQNSDAIFQDENHPKSCERSNIQSFSKAHQDLNVIPTSPQGEVSKLPKGLNNTPKDGNKRSSPWIRT